MIGGLVGNYCQMRMRNTKLIKKIDIFTTRLEESAKADGFEPEFGDQVQFVTVARPSLLVTRLTIRA